VLTVVGGLVGTSFVDVEVGTELVGSDGEAGADGEFVSRTDGGADDAGVDVGVGALLGSDVVVSEPCVASEPRDVGVGVLDGGLVGVFAGARSPPGTGTPGAVGPPSRLTTSMIR
jgi:hypothetical protein